MARARRGPSAIWPGSRRFASTIRCWRRSSANSWPATRHCLPAAPALDRLIQDQSGAGPWAPVVGRLRCLRGIHTLSAVGLGGGDRRLGAFAHPRRLTSYLGLVPSERKLGQQAPPRRDHQGRKLARPAPVDRGRLALPPPAADLVRRAPPPGGPAAGGHRGGRARPAAPAPALGASGRRARGRRTAVAVAVARELACFVWEIARQPD